MYLIKYPYGIWSRRTGNPNIIVRNFNILYLIDLLSGQRKIGKDIADKHFEVNRLDLMDRY